MLNNITIQPKKLQEEPQSSYTKSWTEAQPILTCYDDSSAVKLPNILTYDLHVSFMKICTLKCPRIQHWRDMKIRL